MRDPDEPIPVTEELYRSVAFGEADGEALLPTSIDLPASSVSRQKYLLRLEDALKNGDTGIAVTTPAKLPAPMTSSGGVVHEVRAEDAPAEGDAHAEVRVRRQGQGYSPKYKVGSLLKMELRREIAKSFRVLVPPLPPEQPNG